MQTRLSFQARECRGWPRRARQIGCWLAASVALTSCDPNLEAQGSDSEADTITAPVTHAPGLLKYYGGPIVPNAQVWEIDWNGLYNANTVAPLKAFLPVFLASRMFDWLDGDYHTARAANVGSHNGAQGTNQHIGRPTYAGFRNLGRALVAELTDADVQAALADAVRTGVLPAPNTSSIYVVDFPPGMTITSTNGLRTCDATQAVFNCTYHSTATINGVAVRYTVMPDQSGDCLSMCGNNGPVNNTTMLTSQEIVATILDATYHPGSAFDYPLGWAATNDTTNIADPEHGAICRGIGGQLPGTPYYVQSEYDDETGNCIITKPTTGFSLRSSLANVVLKRYHRDDLLYTDDPSTVIGTSLLSGTAEAVTLDAKGPPGVTFSFAKNPITTGESTQLTIGESFPLPTVGDGTITITATGTDGTTQVINVPLQVVYQPDLFTIQLSTSNLALVSADPLYGHNSVTVQTVLTAGASQPVTYSTAWQGPVPQGMTSSFNPPSGNVNDTTILTFRTNAGVPDGSYPVRITAQGATFGLATDMFVTVTSGPVVYSVTPSSGTLGDSVVIHGTGFSDVAGVTSLSFGPYPVTVFSCTPTDCTVKVPPGTGADQHVIVANASTCKSSAPHANDRFSYVVPTVTGMTPASGPSSGGTYIALTGTGFTPDVPVGAGHTNVTFDGVAAPYVLCTSSTSCTVRSPIHDPGNASVVVNVFGTQVTAPVQFSYHARPALKSIAYSAYYGMAGSIELDGFAADGGTTVALSSSAPQLFAVPETVTVANGFYSANFSAVQTPTDQAQTITLTATLDGASVTTSVDLVVGPPLSVDLGVPALAAGASATARINLSRPAPAGGVPVSLSSSDPEAIAVPATVVVPAGQQTGLVTMTNLYGGPPEHVTITASHGDDTASDSIWVPIDGSCLPRRCPKGAHWNSADCLCEGGLPR